MHAIMLSVAPFPAAVAADSGPLPSVELPQPMVFGLVCAWELVCRVGEQYDELDPPARWTDAVIALKATIRALAARFVVLLCLGGADTGDLLQQAAR